jgi:hypothetical protein
MPSCWRRSARGWAGTSPSGRVRDIVWCSHGSEGDSTPKPHPVAGRVIWTASPVAAHKSAVSAAAPHNVANSPHRTLLMAQPVPTARAATGLIRSRPVPGGSTTATTASPDHGRHCAVPRRQRHPRRGHGWAALRWPASRSRAAARAPAPDRGPRPGWPAGGGKLPPHSGVTEKGRRQQHGGPDGEGPREQTSTGAAARRLPASREAQQ